MFHVKHFENKKIADLTAKKRGEWRKTMNEIMNAQKITSLKNSSLKESLLTIRGAVLSVNASQWEVAQAVHDILVKETFKEDFVTEEKFADFIGISRSNCNKMKKAIDFRNSNETFKDWTLNKIYEIMCLPKEEAPKVLKDYMIDKNDTVKEIREAVKAYKDDTSESKVVADVEPEEAEPEKEEAEPEKEEPKKEEAEPEKEEAGQKTDNENDTKILLLHSFIATLTVEETVKVLYYIKKQHIGDTEAVEEVLKLWK